MRTKILISSIFLYLIFSSFLMSQESYSIARKNVFEFTKEPVLKDDGKTLHIYFETKDYCDVTVAIENKNGKIIRHLVSGVLGPKAPEPFKKSSLKQEILWDKKDDQGRYINDGVEYTIRVSLGLDATFDKSLFWEPKKRWSRHAPLLQATSEGVYVFDEGSGAPQLRLFSRTGKYLKTIYPFSPEKLKELKGLHWKKFPGAESKVPLKLGGLQATLLNSGTQTAFDGIQGVGTTHPPGPYSVRTFAIKNKKISIANERVNRFSTVGGDAGASLYGPKVALTVVRSGRKHLGGGQKINYGPRSSAISHDGKWIYYTGFVWQEFWGTGGTVFYRSHVVTRMPYGSDKSPELFVGNLTPKKAGSGPKDLKVPASVVCDDSGNVLIADYMNDRIQVFSSDKKLIKSIKVKKPVQISIHHKTKELYVFSWFLEDALLWQEKRSKEFIFKPNLTILKSVENPTVVKKYQLPFKNKANAKSGSAYGGLGTQAILHSWGENPIIWLVSDSPHRYNTWDNSGIKIYELENNKFKLMNDFGKETVKSIKRTIPPIRSLLRQRLYTNPTNGDLYVAEGDAGVGKSTGELIKIIPSTGKVSKIALPYDTEDFAFDINGHILLRALRDIGRFDPKTWREVPWDYGNEMKSVNFASSKAEGAGLRRGRLISSIKIPVKRYNHHGGMTVSPNGNLVVSIHGGQEIGNALEAKDNVHSGELPAHLKLYSGRAMAGLVQIFDKHGKLINNDAIPGLAFTHGISIDKDNNLYTMAMVTRLIDGKKFENISTNTIIKIDPKKAKIISSQTKKTIVPLPASKENLPKRKPDVLGSGGGRIGNAWVEGAEWFYGGVGFNGRNTKTVSPPFGCDCSNSRFEMDYFARSFAPELDRYCVVVLDKSGQVITRIGHYGNVDTKGIGLFYFPYVSTYTDKKLYIADPGNHRIVSVNLIYHKTKKLTFINKQK